MDISSLVNNTPPPTSNPDSNSVTMPSSTPTALSTLHDAIDSATADRVRKVLKEICAANPQARELASEALLVPNEGSAKRKRDKGTTPHQQRYEVCMQCDEEYDVLDNPVGACEYHPGKSPSIHLVTCMSKLLI
jgi:hypothetical protein